MRTTQQLYTTNNKPLDTMSSPTGDSGIGNELSTSIKPDLSTFDAINGYDLLLRHQAQQGHSDNALVQNTSNIGEFLVSRGRAVMVKI